MHLLEDIMKKEIALALFAAIAFSGSVAGAFAKDAETRLEESADQERKSDIQESKAVRSAEKGNVDAAEHHAAQAARHNAKAAEHEAQAADKLR
jgi:hypothetical protein